MRSVRIILISLFSSILFLTNSCKEDPGPCPNGLKDVHYQFNSDTIAISYQTNDSVLFEIRNQDSVVLDTCLFIAEKKTYKAHVQGPMCVKGNALGDAFTVTLTSEQWPEKITVTYLTEQYSEPVVMTYKDHSFQYTARTIMGFFGYNYATLKLANTTYYNLCESCDSKRPLSSECTYNSLVNQELGILYLNCFKDVKFTIIKM